MASQSKRRVDLRTIITNKSTRCWKPRSRRRSYERDSPPSDGFHERGRYSRSRTAPARNLSTGPVLSGPRPEEDPRNIDQRRVGGRTHQSCTRRAFHPPLGSVADLLDPFGDLSLRSSAGLFAGETPSFGERYRQREQQGERPRRRPWISQVHWQTETRSTPKNFNSRRGYGRRGHSQPARSCCWPSSPLCSSSECSQPSFYQHTRPSPFTMPSHWEIPRRNWGRPPP